MEPEKIGVPSASRVQLPAIINVDAVGGVLHSKHISSDLRDRDRNLQRIALHGSEGNSSKSDKTRLPLIHEQPNASH